MLALLQRPRTKPPRPAEIPGRDRARHRLPRRREVRRTAAEAALTTTPDAPLIAPNPGIRSGRSSTVAPATTTPAVSHSSGRTSSLSVVAQPMRPTCPGRSAFPKMARCSGRRPAGSRTRRGSFVASSALAAGRSPWARQTTKASIRRTSRPAPRMASSCGRRILWTRAMAYCSAPSLDPTVSACLG